MKRLEYWIDKLAERIKELDPESRIRVTKDTYEGEDAYIFVQSKLSGMFIMRQLTDLQGEAILEDCFIPVLPEPGNKKNYK